VTLKGFSWVRACVTGFLPVFSGVLTGNDVGKKREMGAVVVTVAAAASFFAG
jgi:hypothetical protein